MSDELNANVSARTGFWSDRGDGVDTLIPGDPARIRARAAELRHRSDRADEAGSGLREVELGAWTGAAARAFEDKYGGEPAKWFSASDSLAFAADALDGASVHDHGGVGRPATSLRAGALSGETDD